MDYFGARYLSSPQGRFTSPDPIGGQVSNPQSLNRYAYVMNNPLKFIDPTGMLVQWHDSDKTCRKGESECMSSAQRGYMARLDEMEASDDADTRAEGRRLRNDYDRLDASAAIFEVTKGDGAGASRGDIAYSGQDHFVISLKGNDRAGLSNNQRLAHEFEHGRQILDGELSFWFNGQKWSPFVYDLTDEAKAFRSAFAMERGNAGEFAKNLQARFAFGEAKGIAAAAGFLEHYGPYKDKHIPRGPDNVPSGLSPKYYYPPKR